MNVCKKNIGNIVRRLLCHSLVLSSVQLEFAAYVKFYGFSSKNRMESMQRLPQQKTYRKRSGSVVECLTQDLGGAGWNPIGVTVLCP